MKLFVGTPCYGGMVTTEFCSGLLRTAQSLALSNVAACFLMTAGESLITRGRNAIVEEFLATDFTDLLFVDSDIVFSPEDVRYVVQADADVVAGAYPRKEIDWLRATEAMRAGRDPSEDSCSVVVTPVTGTSTQEGDLLEVKETGTGFMRIRRRVLEQMIAADQSIVYTDGGPRRRDGKRLAIPRVFHADVVDDELDGAPARHYLSEDYWFCRRWRELGGHVYVHTKANLGHVGRYLYRAAPMAVMSGRPSLDGQVQDKDRILRILNGAMDPKLAAAPKRFVDNGAREGALAVWVASKWPGIKMHLYEPRSELRSMLERNMKAYEIAATVHDRCVSVEVGDLVHRDDKLEVA